MTWKNSRMLTTQQWEDLFSMTYITVSTWGKLAVLSANPLPHFKFQPSQAALLFKSEHQLQVEKHCPTRTSVNQIVVWFFSPTSKFTASAWHHIFVEPHEATFLILRSSSRLPCHMQRRCSLHWWTANNSKKQKESIFFTLRMVRHNRCPEGL